MSCDNKVILHAPSNNQLLKFYQSNDTPFWEIQHRETNQDFIRKTVSMSKGAYLIIEHTEALHVIDVNSGNVLIRHQMKIPPWKSIWLPLPKSLDNYVFVIWVAYRSWFYRLCLILKIVNVVRFLKKWAMIKQNTRSY
jgi:hypothetical protein